MSDAETLRNRIHGLEARELVREKIISIKEAREMLGLSAEIAPADRRT